MKRLIIMITAVSFLTACGENKNRTAFGLGTGVLLGTAGYLATKEPGVAMAGLSAGLALGSHIGSAFDDVARLKQEVLSLNDDFQRSKFTKVDEDNNNIAIEIEPTSTNQRDYLNRHCREYDYAYTKNGETSHGRGYACLNEQGIWQELHHENG